MKASMFQSFIILVRLAGLFNYIDHMFFKVIGDVRRLTAEVVVKKIKLTTP